MHDGIIPLKRDTNSRVVVPLAYQSAVLESLHASHWGVVKTKQLARHYVWWPSLDANIEVMVKECDICRQCLRSPLQHYTAWPKTEKPWECVYIDFAGPFKGKMWLLCVDAHSKYLYVGMMEVGQTSSKQTIQVLKDIFALDGLPSTIVTANGTQFTARDFEEFCFQHPPHYLTSISPAFKWRGRTICLHI